MTTRRPGKPDTYVFTVDPMSGPDAEVFRGVREIVKQVNRDLRRSGAHARYRLSLSPRAPRPEFRWKYEAYSRRVRLEDASSADVYLSLVSADPRGRNEPGSRARRR